MFKLTQVVNFAFHIEHLSVFGLPASYAFLQQLSLSPTVTETYWCYSHWSTGICSSRSCSGDVDDDEYDYD